MHLRGLVITATNWHVRR